VNEATFLEGLRRGKRSLRTELVGDTQVFYQDSSLIVLSFDDRDDCIANSYGFADLQSDFGMLAFIDHGDTPYLYQVSRCPLESLFMPRLILRSFCKQKDATEN
jgi:hypothetical protein